ncbi:MAG TPA: DNA-formamidopyrimidine glycosylase family protein [Nitriliruptoraceae bacterium]|nr:DNA-formamidopyrimidine glycosylase family protein [Nitriliruptoraceae bacterium]
MPELPDIEDYRAALQARLVGNVVAKVRVTSFALLRTFDPPVDALHGQVVTEIRRMGKRLVFVFGDHVDADGAAEPLFAVLHLMIAGRLRWEAYGAKVPGRIGMAAFDVTAPDATPVGTLILTEAGTKRRASLHVVREDDLGDHDRGGLEVLDASRDEFAAAITTTNRTLKRGLTDPTILSGIGNAYSDEILHAAELSPVARTQQLDDDELTRLYEATVAMLTQWTQRLRDETGDGFPGKVTAFRDDFATHGKFGEPCPVCGTSIARISYADKETNYCPGCQTGGRLLKDRSLSRLLKDDWPATIDEAEAG